MFEGSLLPCRLVDPYRRTRGISRTGSGGASTPGCPSPSTGPRAQASFFYILHIFWIFGIGILDFIFNGFCEYSIFSNRGCFDTIAIAIVAIVAIAIAIATVAIAIVSQKATGCFSIFGLEVSRETPEEKMQHSEASQSSHFFVFVFVFFSFRFRFLFRCFHFHFIFFVITKFVASITIPSEPEGEPSSESFPQMMPR